MTVEEYRALIAGKPAPKRSKPGGRADGPNQTERQYAEKFLVLGSNVGFAFEAITIRLDAMTTYTPDWFELTTDVVTIHEVKGQHRFKRAGREKFKRARHEIPRYRWVWGELKDGVWRREVWEPGEKKPRRESIPVEV